MNRILSSGGAPTARGGRSTLWALNKACARHGLGLCLASGVSAENASLLVRDTGAAQVHAASSLAVETRRGASLDLFYATEKVVSEPKCRHLLAELANDRAHLRSQASTDRLERLNLAQVSERGHQAAPTNPLCNGGTSIFGGWFS